MFEVSNEARDEEAVKRRAGKYLQEGPSSFFAKIRPVTLDRPHVEQGIHAFNADREKTKRQLYIAAASMAAPITAGVLFITYGHFSRAGGFGASFAGTGISLCVIFLIAAWEMANQKNAPSDEEIESHILNNTTDIFELQKRMENFQGQRDTINRRLYVGAALGLAPIAAGVVLATAYHGATSFNTNFGLIYGGAIFSAVLLMAALNNPLPKAVELAEERFAPVASL